MHHSTSGFFGSNFRASLNLSIACDIVRPQEGTIVMRSKASLRQICKEQVEELEVDFRL